MESGAQYFQMLSKKRMIWVNLNKNPLQKYVNDAQKELSEWFYEKIPDDTENTLTNQQKLCNAADGYMLRINCSYDYHMRMELESHKVKLDDYFKMEFAFVPGEFRNEFFTRVRSITGNRRANSLDALGPHPILNISKAILAEKSQSLIIGLKKQAAAARAIVQKQLDSKGEQKLGLLLTAWPKLVQGIEAFSKEAEVLVVTRPESDLLKLAKDMILSYYHGLFKDYFEDISKKSQDIFDGLSLFNYVLRQNIDIGNNIEI